MVDTTHDIRPQHDVDYGAHNAIMVAWYMEDDPDRVLPVWAYDSDRSWLETEMEVRERQARRPDYALRALTLDGAPANIRTIMRRIEQDRWLIEQADALMRDWNEPFDGYEGPGQYVARMLEQWASQNKLEARVSYDLRAASYMAVYMVGRVMEIMDTGKASVAEGYKGGE